MFFFSSALHQAWQNRVVCSSTLYLSPSVFLSLCCSVTWRGMWVEWLQTALLIGLIFQRVHQSWHSLMERHSTGTLWSLHSPPVSLRFSHSSTMLPCWRSPSHKARDVNNEVIITIVKLIILRIVCSYQSENWNPAMIGMRFESSICSYRWPEGTQVLQMERMIRFDFFCISMMLSSIDFDEKRVKSSHNYCMISKLRRCRRS